MMGSDGPETPSSPRSIQSDVDRGASAEKTSRPNEEPPIESVGPKVFLDKVYLVGTQAKIFYDDVRRTLPPEVDSLDEATRIALAMQVEERNCLQAEIDLASRRCRYNTFTSHHHGLTATNLQKKLEKVSQAVSVSIADAIKNHKASKLPHNTNVQNPNAGGSPVQAKGIPGRPAATNFQPHQLTFPPNATHLQPSQAANGPHMPNPGASGHVQPNMTYRIGAPPNLPNLQAPQRANGPHMTEPGASDHIWPFMQPRTPLGAIGQFSPGMSLGRRPSNSALQQAAQAVRSLQLPQPGASHVQGPPNSANMQAPQFAAGMLPISLTASEQEIPPSVVDASSKNLASKPADGTPSPHASASGDPVRTPSQVIAPSAADTAGENVASRLADGMPPPHISASGIPVRTPQVIPPSVIDTSAKNEASQPADGKPSPHPVADGGPVQTPAQVTPPSVVDTSSRNEASQPVDGTHLPHVSGNGKRPRSDSSTSDPSVRRKRLQYVDGRISIQELPSDSATSAVQSVIIGSK